MSESPGKAVFLSYASQDAEAARRICETLRTAGVEVWLDQEGGLFGGDAWDRKIREQIRACALFVTIISANTQARREGYFRLEWKLAAQRTHMRSERTAFLLPVVIDATRDADADVPAEFRAVQWTRIGSADSLAAFCERVKTLLGTPVVAGVAAPGPIPASARPATTNHARSRSWLVPSGILAVAALVLLALWQPWKSNGPPAAPATALSSAAPPPPDFAPAKSVAVLPFTNLSPDPENAFFCDGMHEDILTTLANIRELKVISRTSTLRYRNNTRPQREVAGELGAAHVLEGSVRRDGKRVRITAQLINAATDEHVWAETFDRGLDDIFAIQSEIAQRIAKALQAAISPVERARIEKLPTQNQVAYDRYLQGRDLFNKGTKEGNDRARALLREALALDPKFALAWSALADTYVLLLVAEMEPPSVARVEGRKAVERALELDPHLAEAHLSLAVILLNFEWDWARAETHFRRALELNDRIALIHHQYGWFLCSRRRFEEARIHMEKAIDLNPRDPFFVGDLNAPLHFLGRRAEARAQAEKAIAIDPEFGYGYAVRGMEEIRAKRWGPARAALAKARAMDPAPMVLGWSGVAAAGAGTAEGRAEAREMLQQLERLSQTRYVSPFDRAVIHAALNEPDQAFFHLEKCYEDRGFPLLYLPLDPHLENLRADPRFAVLWDKMNFNLPR